MSRVGRFRCLVLAFLLPSCGLIAESPPPPLDYTGPGFVAARDAYASELAALQTLRTTALTRVLLLYLENAGEMMKEKSKTRNVTGMAVAGTAKTIFESALTNLAATGKMELPSKVRRELEPMLEACTTATKKITDEFETSKKALDDQTLTRFRALVVKMRPELAGEAAAADLKHEFSEFITATPVVVVSVKAGTNTVPGAVSSSTGTTHAAYWGALGEAKKWVTIARWEGTVSSMDVVAISVSQMQAGTNRSEKANPIAGVDSHFEYTSLYAFPTKMPVAVRLKSVAGREGGEVLEWPSAGNDFTLSVRLAASRYPSVHAFEFQVGVSGEGAAQMFSGAPMEGTTGKEEPAPPVFLTLSTQPAGAAVVVDGTVLRETRTPCRIPVQPGVHALELMLQGCEPMRLTNEEFKANRSVTWKFKQDPRVVVKTCSLSADVAQWYPSGVVIQGDAILSIKADGEWSCGARGEHCSAAGYPDSVPTYKHYADLALRQLRDANYGALVARVGKDGVPFVVGQGTRLRVTGRGLLYFDINEVTGKAARSDNTGELTIRVGILPADVTPTGP